MNCYNNKVYTVCVESNNGQEYEKVFPENSKIALYIPGQNYNLEYDVTNQNRITDTLKILFDDEEFYLIIRAVENDSVLNKYHLDAGFGYFILHFIENELVDLGGIDRNTYETYYFNKNDFNTNKGEKPSVLQAPIVALYAPGLYTKGLRELGYKADYMVNYTGEDKHFLEYEPDFDLDLQGNTTEVCRARTIEFMIYALKHYDIMHLHSNCSLLLGADRLWYQNSDMGYLIKMGKKIVSSYWGICDMTLKGEYDKFDWHSECNVCVNLRPILCENKRYNRVIEITRKYATVLLTNGRGFLTDPSIIWMDNPIELDKYNPDIRKNIPEKFKLPPTDNIRIYHSFGNMEKREDIKGSCFVKEAVDRLQREGYAVELMFFHNIDHKDLKYYQAQADIVVDQLFVGWHGSTGVECLALGLPVITYINPSVENYVKSQLKREIPFVSAMPQNIYEVLKEMINDIKGCKNLGIQAGKYAQKYHDYKVVAKRLSEIYEKLNMEGNADEYV